MTKNDLKIGNWVYRKNRFDNDQPLEVIYVLTELKSFSIVYNELDFPKADESEIPYEDLVEVRLADSILKKLGFTDFNSKTSIEDYAGFKLYNYRDMQFAFNGDSLYQFILEIKKPENYTGVTVFGDSFEFAHELQNFLKDIK